MIAVISYLPPSDPVEWVGNNVAHYLFPRRAVTFDMAKAVGFLTGQPFPRICFPMNMPDDRLVINPDKRRCER